MPLKIRNADVKGQNTEHDPAAVQIGPNSSHHFFFFTLSHLQPDLAPHFTAVGPAAAAASWARKHTVRSNKTFSNPSGGGREVHSLRIQEIDRKKNL